MVSAMLCVLRDRDCCCSPREKNSPDRLQSSSTRARRIVVPIVVGQELVDSTTLPPHPISRSWSAFTLTSFNFRPPCRFGFCVWCCPRPRRLPEIAYVHRELDVAIIHNRDHKINTVPVCCDDVVGLVLISPVSLLLSMFGGLSNKG